MSTDVNLQHGFSTMETSDCSGATLPTCVIATVCCCGVLSKIDCSPCGISTVLCTTWNLSLHDHRNVDHLVDELNLRHSDCFLDVIGPRELASASRQGH